MVLKLCVPSLLTIRMVVIAPYWVWFGDIISKFATVLIICTWVQRGMIYFLYGCCTMESRHIQYPLYQCVLYFLPFQWKLVDPKWIVLWLTRCIIITRRDKNEIDRVILIWFSRPQACEKKWCYWREDCSVISRSCK